MGKWGESQAGRRVRLSLERALLRVLCVLSSGPSAPAVESGLYRMRVFGGPLRGMYLSVPRLERAAFGLGSYEPHAVQAIRDYVRPGMTAYDVGAHAGYLSLVLARQVGKEGQVFCFEPNPDNLRALRVNAQINRLDNMVPVGRAVSDSSGTVSFATYGYSFVGHIVHDHMPADAHLLTVSVVSLDDYVYAERHPAPGFVKVDVEGAEEQVIIGASRLLYSARPVVLAEVRGHQVWERVTEFMKARGYHSRLLEAGGWSMKKDDLTDVLFVPEAQPT